MIDVTIFDILPKQRLTNIQKSKHTEWSLCPLYDGLIWKEQKDIPSLKVTNKKIFHSTHESEIRE